MGDFFTSKQDVALAKAIVSKSADIYISPEITPEGKDTAVLNKTTPSASTFTPAVSPAWTVDELIGMRVVIQDDNNNAHEFIIADNDAVSFTVDLTSDEDSNDPSADYTDLATFSYILWGTEEFLGYTEESSFNDEEEDKVFEIDTPREEVRSDLLKRTVSLETTIRSNKAGLLKAVHNMEDTSNTTYYVLTAGSDPSARTRYYVTLKNENVNGKATQLRLFWTFIKPNGARSVGGGDDYENIPVMILVHSQPLFNKQNNLYRAREEK